MTYLKVCCIHYFSICQQLLVSCWDSTDLQACYNIVSVSATQKKMRTDILENRRFIKVLCAIVAIFAYSNTNTIIANTLNTFWRIEGAIKVVHARQDCSVSSRGWRKTGCPVPNWRAYNLETKLSRAFCVLNQHSINQSINTVDMSCVLVSF